MGLALAIDYTLLMISRFRDELADGASRDDALVRTMVIGGPHRGCSPRRRSRLSMAVMVLFPMHFLKSFAYAGVADGRVRRGRRDRGDTRRTGSARRSPGFARRAPARPPHARPPEPQPVPVEQRFWYRSASCVMHQAVPLGLAGVALLLLLGAPFLSVQLGIPRRSRAADARPPRIRSATSCGATSSTTPTPR